MYNCRFNLLGLITQWSPTGLLEHYHTLYTRDRTENTKANAHVQL